MAVIWAYCRVSTAKEEQEESLEAQEAWARGFALEQAAELRVFKEQASAKTTIGRPIFQAMMAELSRVPKARRPAQLIVTALDRLSRNLRDTLNVVEVLREHAVTLYQRGLGVIGSDTFPEKAALAGMSLAGEAENYGRSIRAKASWDRRRAEGKPTSNKHPYGLQLQGERDVPIPESARWVRKAFEWYDSGDGMFTIANRFANGAPAHTWLTSRVGPDGERVRKTRRPTLWESNRIGKLLRQQRYRSSIVPADLYDRVQKRLATLAKTGSRRTREYPLTAALRCEHCHRRLHGRASGGTRNTRATGETARYVNRLRYYECYVCHYRLNADALERKFFQTIGDLTASKALLMHWISTPAMSSGDRKELERSVRLLERDCSEVEAQSRLDRIFDLALSAGLKESELRRQVERHRESLVAKRAELSTARAQLDGHVERTRSTEAALELLAKFHMLYERATYQLKRELLSSLTDALGGATTTRDGLTWSKPSALVRHEMGIASVAPRKPLQRKSRK